MLCKKIIPFKVGKLSIVIFLMTLQGTVLGARQLAVDVFADHSIDLAHISLLNELVVEVGDGTGTFASPVTHPLGFNPVNISFGDYNSDGHNDLIALDSSGDLLLSLNNGANGFQVGTVLSVGLQLTESILAFSTGDLNGDGNQDIVVVVSGIVNGRAVILYGNGAGGFAPHVDIDLGLLTVASTSLKLSDLNIDGTVDILIKDISGVVHLILSDGLGDYFPPATINGTFPAGDIYFADFNNDEIPDMIVMDEILGLVTVRLGNGNGTFLSGIGVAVGLTPKDLVAVDINLDGNRDIAVVNLGDNSVDVYIGDGIGGLLELVGTALEDLLGIIPALSLPITIVSKDFNNDCRMDLGIWNELTQSYTIQLNQTGPDSNDLIFCSRFENQ